MMTVVTPDKSPDARARMVASRAVDCNIRLHLADRTYVTGRITECEFLNWQYRDGHRKRAIFGITIVAGKDEKWQYRYTVLEVPNPDSDEKAEVQVLEFESEENN